MCTAPGPIPIAVFVEVSFKYRLEQDHQRRLHYPVLHRRDAQRPRFAIGLRYPDSQHRTGPVAAVYQLGLHAIEEGAGGSSHCLRRDSVHSG